MRKTAKNLFKKLLPKTIGGLVFGVSAGVGIIAGIYFTVAFNEPISSNSGFTEPTNVRTKGDWFSYGKGWAPNASGAGSTALSKATCDSAYGWYWFEDGNGDGDTTDEEDGICVKATSTVVASTPGYDSWNGMGDCLTYDNTYIPDYTCAGNFPNGYVVVETYRAYSDSGCVHGSDTSYEEGDCALCEADCFDGKKDLPDRGSYTASGAQASPGNEGPITTEVLKNWKGTRLPSSEDYFGFCGSGGTLVLGDYKTGCSSDTTVGTYGHQNGRTDECLSLSNFGSHEWLSERHYYSVARVAGNYACSFFNNGVVSNAYRFRAVFRP